MTLSAMEIDTPLTGTRYNTVLHRDLSLVRAANLRTRDW